ncbi:uncharacterized protein LOC115592365 [Scomber scombrus]|uniref:Uncharacterized protein LOC115592365 n=1 Tax=Scomber scombrus TaxID=13677 RepID=A0AAV1PDV8_SCOSC
MRHLNGFFLRSVRRGEEPLQCYHSHDGATERADKPDLKEDIRRLSDELQNKGSLLSNFMDVASVQSKEIALLSTILRDTVAWDPASGPQLSSCSTPKPPWTEVAARKRDSTASPPCLNLSNRFTALSADNLVHPDDPPAAPPRPVTTLADSAAPPKSLPRPGLKQRPSSRSKTCPQA